ncbi:MAG: response regulator, partial [Lentilitoribacter sp.]
MSVVLFVDDEEHIRLAAAQAFELNDLEAELFENGLDALARIDEQLDAVVVTDVKMPSIGGL